MSETSQRKYRIGDDFPDHEKVYDLAPVTGNTLTQALTTFHDSQNFQN
jgi:hypothetical protein